MVPGKNLVRVVGDLKMVSGNSSRFSPAIYNRLSFEAYLKFPGISKIFDIGFIRFDHKKLNSLYMFVTFDDLHPGFVKFSIKDDEFVANSVYYVIDHEWEIRYDSEGQVMYTYKTRQEGDVLLIDKIKDEKIIETQVIKKDDIKEFPELYEDIKNNDLLEKSGPEFKFFTKDEGNIVYLYVNHYETRKDLRSVLDFVNGVSLLV
jgi:hypothetical protein